MKGTVFSASSSGGGLLRAYTKKYRTTPHNACRSSAVFGRLPVKGPSSLRCVAAVRRCWCQRKVSAGVYSENARACAIAVVVAYQVVRGTSGGAGGGSSQKLHEVVTAQELMVKTLSNKKCTNAELM